MPALSPEGRAMFERDLAAAVERERQASLDKYVLAAVAYRAGMTVRDLAAIFGVSSSTATEWKALGEEELRRRAGQSEPSDPA